MCGIIGVIPSKNTNQLSITKIMKQLTYLDTLRGYDGTGAFWLDKQEKAAKFVKKPCVGGIFINLKDTQEAYSNIHKKTFLVIHNRASTVGENTEDNTHPFSYGSVVGCHNGTLHGTRTFGHKNYPVDSMAIFDSLDTDNDTSVTMNKLQGAASLVWYDSRTENLHFWRNKERPMWFIYTKNGTTFFASEPWMVEGILDRENVDITKVVELTTETLLSYSCTESKWLPQENIKQGSYTHHAHNYSSYDDYYSERSVSGNVFTLPEVPKKAMTLSKDDLFSNERIAIADLPFVIPHTDAKVFEHLETVNIMPESIWKQEVKVGHHIFFCITKDEKLGNNKDVKRVYGELHNLNDVVIDCYMPTIVIDFTYSQRTMLYGKVNSIKVENGLKYVTVIYPRSTIVEDPLYNYVANIKAN